MQPWIIHAEVNDVKDAQVVDLMQRCYVLEANVVSRPHFKVWPLVGLIFVLGLMLLFIFACILASWP